MGRAVAAGVGALALLTVLAGCSSGDASPSPATASAPTTTAAPAAPGVRTYVALGDSYTAGPGIDPVQAGAGLCGRSQHNWPTRVAASLDLSLSDVSCSGATTADLASTVESGAVASTTDVVTVSAGGNDGGLYLSLLRACTGADTCREFATDQAPPIIRRTAADVAALLRQVSAAAPDATIRLVGYPRIMPDTGTCDAVGISSADGASVVAAETALDTALAGAADTAGVDYVSLRRASEGHDACAGDEAWTNGRSAAPGDGILFHPDSRGMAAIARLVAASITAG